MSELVLRAFNLRREEARSTFLFATLCFIWSFALTLSMKYSDSLFILQVGSEYLPATYRYESIGMIFLSTFLLYAYGRYSVIRIFQGITLVALLFYSFVSYCFTTETLTQGRALWFALNIFGTQFFTVGITVIWTLVDHFHEVGRAKRLFGLYSSSIFLGSITTGLIMKSAILERTSFTLLLSCLILLTALFVTLLSHLSPVAPKKKRCTFSLKKLLVGISGSRYALLIITANLLTFLLWVITEYNYLRAFEQHFQGVQHEQISPLPQFMGLCLAVVGLFNLIFGLFFYSRLVDRCGVGNVLLYSPILFLLMFAGWYVTDLFLFPLMGVFIVEGTLYVIDDSNFSLLIKGLPRSFRNQVRVVIESFFEPIGMLLSGIILAIPSIDTRLVGLILAALLTCVAFSLKTTYNRRHSGDSNKRKIC